MINTELPGLFIWRWLSFISDQEEWILSSISACVCVVHPDLRRYPLSLAGFPSLLVGEWIYHACFMTQCAGISVYQLVIMQIEGY